MIVTEIVDIIRKINRNWINPVAISWACTAEKVPSDFRQSIQVRHMQSRLFTEFSNSHFSLLRLSGLRHSSSSYQVQDVVSFWGESFVFLTGVLYLYMHFSNQYTLQAWINSFSYLFFCTFFFDGSDTFELPSAVQTGLAGTYNISISILKGSRRGDRKVQCRTELQFSRLVTKNTVQTYQTCHSRG